MTEAEWHSAHIGVLVLHARKLSLVRKLRLFNCTCGRMLLPWIGNPDVEKALSRAEQFADGAITASTMERWCRKVVQQRDALEIRSQSSAERKAYWVCVFACLPDQEVATDGWRYFVSHDNAYGHNFEEVVLPRLYSTFRDIFGNPFRPISFAPSWRTDTVRALAARMYDSRDFVAMPILADALQDAGCDNLDILAHCRDATQPHVRGCWVVDLVLGKE